MKGFVVGINFQKLKWLERSTTQKKRTIEIENHK
jgi:hypothetical protein